MKTALITGSSGLVGSACVRHFAARGWKVYGLDGNQRADFFGPDGDTTDNLNLLLDGCSGFVPRYATVCSWFCVESLVREARPGLVIHCAAQPSHDLAASRPLDDFRVNALGTLNLLEAVRRHAPGAVFVFLSTNKVYGDAPNRARVTPGGWKLRAEDYPFLETETRFDLPMRWRDGFDEFLPVDHCTHSLFGCSKLAADLYVQEYGRYFGLKTVCFRAGCLTGGTHAGALQHGFLAYLAKCVREGRPYKVYGHKGKQVRDQLHAADVATACEAFYQNPRPGEVYNLGGGRENSISVLEAIQAFEGATGKRLAWEYVDEPRRGDHCVWITDTRKFRSHYPAWSVAWHLGAIIAELIGVKELADVPAEVPRGDR